MVYYHLRSSILLSKPFDPASEIFDDLVDMSFEMCGGGIILLGRNGIDCFHALEGLEDSAVGWVLLWHGVGFWRFGSLNI